MITIDRTNAAIVGIDLFTVDPRHTDALINTIVSEQLSIWTSSYYFVSASVHRSLDSIRVFTYSQWVPKFDYRVLPVPTTFLEFFPPDSHLLEVFASRSRAAEVSIVKGELTTHLAEFRMKPENQHDMVAHASVEVEQAINSSPGLLSATFHRSFDGTRVFNYGQWESLEAFNTILKQPGFNPDQPYWEGIARNEFYLHHVVHTQAKAT